MSSVTSAVVALTTQRYLNEGNRAWNKAIKRSITYSRHIGRWACVMRSKGGTAFASSANRRYVWPIVMGLRKR